jgi:hypothetical protein
VCGGLSGLGFLDGLMYSPIDDEWLGKRATLVIKIDFLSKFFSLCFWVLDDGL